MCSSDLSAAQLLQGFSDDDLDPLSISGLTASGGGQIAAQADGSWLFIPDPGFVGSVELSYTVNDGHGLSIGGQQLIVVKPPNSPGSGSVVIGAGGTPSAAVQGTPLTISHTLADADGLGPLTVNWSADGVPIAGANGFSFTPGQGQVGQVIRARISYLDGLQYAESSESLPTAPVANINDPASGTVTITGPTGTTPSQGELITASAVLVDPDGVTTPSYDWYADDVLLAGLGNGKAGVLLNQSHVGRRIRAVAVFTDGFGTVERVSSAPTDPILNINDAPVGSVSIVGPASVGINLLALPTLGDADGLGVFSYAWRANGVAIGGATGASYMITNADLGKTLSVAVSYTDGYGQLETVVSGATAAVGQPVVVNATGTIGNDLLVGNALNDSLRGGLGNDSLIGYTGNDLLVGGDGSDDLQGGDGSDLYLIELAKDHASAEVRDFGTSGVDEIRFADPGKTGTLTLFAGEVGLERAVIGTGTAAVANSSGTSSLNIDASAAPNGLTLVGNGGRNQLLGSNFNDSLLGGAGADDLQGRGGDDVYTVDNIGDAIIEGVGGGFDGVQSSVSFTLPANVEDLLLTGTAAINGSGNGLANTITGNGARNVLDGGGGLDLLVGGEGGDLYLVAVAADHPGAEISDGGINGVDELRFTADAGVLTLFAGDTGLEQVVLGTGSATAAVTTGKGAVGVNAAAVANALVLSGNDGNNVIIGTAFADRLQGRLGNDSLTGSAGADLFVFDTALNGTTNRDVITDFEPGIDRILLKASLFPGSGTVGSTLAADRFLAGPEVINGADANDMILLNTSTGVLAYDSDGSGKRPRSLSPSCHWGWRRWSPPPTSRSCFEAGSTAAGTRRSVVPPNPLNEQPQAVKSFLGEGSGTDHGDASQHIPMGTGCLFMLENNVAQESAATGRPQAGMKTQHTS